MKKYASAAVRLLCLVLCVSLLAAYMPATATAQVNFGFCGGDLTWALDDQGTLTISGTGDMDPYVQGCSPWYEDRERIQRVVISYGVTSIGASAFEDCADLQFITIPGSVATIEKWAFSGCSSLSTVTLPGGVASIDFGAFYGCSALSAITLPNSLTKIDDKAFYDCGGLKQITIPAGVAEIGDGAFSDCSALSKIRFCGKAPIIGASPFSGVTAAAYYPEGDGSWTRAVMQSCGGKLTWSVDAGAEFEKFDINLAQAVLGNALNLFFLFPADAYTDWTGCYAVVTKTYGDGRQARSITVPASQWEEKTSGGTLLKRVGFYNISAKEMGDEIHIVVFDAQGNAISNQGSDSLSSYLIRMLTKSSNPKFRRLAVDMLNYGAAAQTQFQYNTGNLINAGLTEAQKAWGTTQDVLCANRQTNAVNLRGITVSLNSSVVMMVYFAGQTADMKATVTFTNHAGKTITAEVGSTNTANGYGFLVKQIAVADMRTLVTVTAYNADGSVYGTVTDSVESYVARMGANKPINQAIMKFSDSAYAYLH